jgi:hypothetical protein
MFVIKFEDLPSNLGSGRGLCIANVEGIMRKFYTKGIKSDGNVVVINIDTGKEEEHSPNVPANFFVIEKE